MPSKCEFCGKRFASHHYLQIHRRLHTGEHPYKCDDCEATFAMKQQLQAHVNRKCQPPQQNRVRWVQTIIGSGGRGVQTIGYVNPHSKTGSNWYTCQFRKRVRCVQTLTGLGLGLYKPQYKKLQWVQTNCTN